MRTLGLLGGMSCESTTIYYRAINEYVRALSGSPLSSAKILLYSFNFEEVADLQHKGEWDQLGAVLAERAVALERAGADGVAICTNTMHLLAPAVIAALKVPLLHIVPPLAAAIKRLGVDRVGLLGTRFTMKEGFIKQPLLEDHGIETVVPEGESADLVHRMIYAELTRGEVRPESSAALRRVIDELRQRSAGAVILGCTELGLAVRQEDVGLHLLDTAQIHAKYLADWSLE